MNRFIVPGLVVVAAVTGTATLAIAITDPSGAAPAQPRTPRGPIATVAGSHPLTTLTLRSARRTGPRSSPWSSTRASVAVRIRPGCRRCASTTATTACACSTRSTAARPCRCATPRASACARISAKFAAPPAGVDEVSVQARGFPSFDRVPLGR